MLTHLLSYFMGRIASLRRPRAIVKLMIRAYANLYKISLADVVGQLNDFDTLDQFFTRRLKPEARPVGSGLVSPADGRFYSSGRIESDTVLQVKGSPYSLGRLLGGAEFSFERGTFLTIYLAPHDYHRVHAPCDMRITRVVHIPGRLWPVNGLAVRNVNSLFAKNERVVIHFEVQASDLPRARGALVAVGAFNVGSIELAFMRLRTNLTPLFNPKVPTEYHLGEAIHLSKGQELFTFHLGSTVVLCLDGQFECAGLIAADTDAVVKQGQTIWSGI